MGLIGNKVKKTMKKTVNKIKEKGQEVLPKIFSVKNVKKAAALGLVFASMAGFAGCGDRAEVEPIPVEYNVEIEALKQKVNELSAIINQKDETSAEEETTVNDKTNTELQEKIAALEKIINDLENGKTSDSETIAELNKKIENLNKDIEEMSSNLDENSSFVIKNKILDAIDGTLNDYARLDVRLGSTQKGEAAYYCIYSSVNGDFASVDTRDISFLQKDGILYYENNKTKEEYITKGEGSLYNQLKSEFIFKGYEFSKSETEGVDFEGYSTDGSETKIEVRLSEDKSKIEFYSTVDKEGQYQTIDFIFVNNYLVEDEILYVERQIEQYKYAKELIKRTTYDVLDSEYVRELNQVISEGEMDRHESYFSGDKYVHLCDDGYQKFKVSSEGGYKNLLKLNDEIVNVYENQNSNSVPQAKDGIQELGFNSCLRSLDSEIKVRILQCDSSEGKSSYSFEYSVGQESAIYTYNFKEEGLFSITVEYYTGSIQTIDFSFVTKEEFEAKYAEVEAIIDAALEAKESLEV